MVGTSSAHRKDGGKNDEERRLISYYMNSWYINDLSPGRGDFDRIICMPAVFVKMLTKINFLVVFPVNVHLRCTYVVHCISLQSIIAKQLQQAFCLRTFTTVAPAVWGFSWKGCSARCIEETISVPRSILTWDLSRTMILFVLVLQESSVCTTQCIICSCPNERSWLFNWLCLRRHPCRNVAGTCFYDAVQLSPLMHHSAIPGSIGSPFVLSKVGSIAPFSHQMLSVCSGN